MILTLPSLGCFTSPYEILYSYNQSTTLPVINQDTRAQRPFISSRHTETLLIKICCTNMIFSKQKCSDNSYLRNMPIIFSLKSTVLLQRANLQNENPTSCILARVTKAQLVKFNLLRHMGTVYGVFFSAYRLSSEKGRFLKAGLVKAI